MEQKRFSRALVRMASRLSAAWRIVGNILRRVSTGLPSDLRRYLYPRALNKTKPEMSYVCAFISCNRKETLELIA
jgi:hypothetical protein